MISPLAHIDPKATIGKNVTIEPFTMIGENVTIGDNTWIGPNVTVFSGASIGKNCKIFPGAVIAGIPQDLKFQGEDSTVMIGDNTIAGHVSIDDWAIVGGSSAVHQFVKIGMHAMVSGGSLVRKDVPPFTKAAREPLSYAGVNSLGLRRRGFSSESISHIQEVYRYLFLNSMNNSRALEEIEVNLPATKERDEILNFIRSSERGVMQGYIN